MRAVTVSVESDATSTPPPAKYLTLIINRGVNLCRHGFRLYRCIDCGSDPAAYGLSNHHAEDIGTDEE